MEKNSPEKKIVSYLLKQSQVVEPIVNTLQLFLDQDSSLETK